MRLLLVVVLVALALPSLAAPVIVPRPGTPEWNRYALVVGLGRIPAAQSVAPTREQAHRFLAHLQGLQQADATNDTLFTALVLSFSEAQRAYIRQHIKRPKGACGCPCSTWNPVLRQALALMRTRSGSPAVPPLGPVPDEPDGLPAFRNAPETLALLQGILSLEKEPKLRVTRAQAGKLVGVLDRLRRSVGNVELHMRSLDQLLTAGQRTYIRREGVQWFPGLTAAELDRRWEAWLARAVREMSRSAAR